MTGNASRIIVLSRNDYNRARSYAPELLIDPSLKVIAVPPRPPDDQDPIYEHLGDRLRPGTLLVRNIWRPGDFVEATVAHEELSLQKFNLFAIVCQRLGATRLEVTEIEEVTDEGRQSGKAGLSAGVGKGSGSFANETTVKVARRLIAHWSWAGSPADIAQAALLARDSGLAQDSVVNGLINQRGYDANVLAEHHLEMDISSEARRELQAALQVQSIARKLGPSFDADFQILRNQTHSIRLRVTIAFISPAGDRHVGGR